MPRRRPAIPSLAILTLALLASLLLSPGVPSPAEAAGPAAPAAAAPTDLRRWIGRYPSEAEGGRPVWRHPRFRDAVAAVLDARRLHTASTFLAVETPITGTADWILVSACRPHACTDENVTIAIQARTAAVRICWKELTPLGAESLTLYRSGAPPRALEAPPGTSCQSIDPTGVPD